MEALIIYGGAERFRRRIQGIKKYHTNFDAGHQPVYAMGMTEAGIDQIQDDIIAEFSLFDSWEDRYRYLIDLGRKLPPYPEEFRDEAHKVRGCQSQVWLHPRMEGELLHFDAASDAVIVSGLIALLLRLFSGQKPADIAAAAPRFIAAIGLGEHLSPTRSNGLYAMIGAIKSIAAGHLAQKG